MSRKVTHGRSNFSRRAPVIALAAAITLVMAGLILAITNERAFKAQKIDEVTVEGRILSLIVIAALDFNDRAAAQNPSTR